MNLVLAPDNFKRAYHCVVSNRGAPGANGMTVADLAGYVKQGLADAKNKAASR